MVNSGQSNKEEENCIRRNSMWTAVLGTASILHNIIKRGNSVNNALLGGVKLSYRLH